MRLSRRRILLDGKPSLVMSGEVHYFRLLPEMWASRLDWLVDAGCNAVATYMPWLIHERPDGSFDFSTGHRDLPAFLDLAEERGLAVIARPGPFVMAELKNEGIPYRIHRDLPHLHPVGWNGTPAPTRTLDYLAPDFLREVDRWYAAILPLLAGRVAALQLDNEIGMLSWVSNTPDLTDGVLADFAQWAAERYDVAARYGAWTSDASALRSPPAPALALHHDLSDYMRDRYARYIAFLRERAETYGVGGPYLINIHGTGGGRGRTYPIGISQLYRGYAGQPQMTSGSDHYLGDLTVGNVADLYVGNAFMAAVHDADQPLTSLEFEAGVSDYAEGLDQLVPPEALALKVRLCLAQGNRLINYYLFAGGYNWPLDEPADDGNDRIAFTGERHGFGAPIGPEGEPNLSYPALREVTRAARGVAGLLADMDEEHDGLALGFVPDHYLTEYRHPGDAGRAEVVADLERFRGMGARDILARALLLAGFSFPAVNLQSPAAALPEVIVLAGATTLGTGVQQRLADHVRGGGRLLLAGVLPQRDVDGSPCTILADALGLRAGPAVHGSAESFPSVRAAGLSEVRVEVFQPLTGEGEILAADVASGAPVGMAVRAGRGRAVVLTCDYPCHLDFWRSLLARLDVRPRHTHDAPVPGLIVTSTADAAGRRLIHLINVAPVEQTFTLHRHGEPLFGGSPIRLAARSGAMLPEDVGPVAWSTCELAGASGDGVLLRRRHAAEAALVNGRAVRWEEGPAHPGEVVRLPV
ncbi:glycosyl hydrolase [Nonomuraea sp. MG754425]|uniref:beta-galactosidase n=1 Tax=Nonomuraea sp. MG754425 TaxID=2570319 RepID=UPI001F301591|nr:beta-galactosidase [Nonomuraea sp. MG754425]MCF6471784.1 glycosyl hydrolase [Nonomuraea sp. MG754425]